MRDFPKMLIAASTALLVLGAVFWMLYMEAQGRVKETAPATEDRSLVDTTPIDDDEPPPPEKPELPPPVIAVQLPETLELPCVFELPRAATLQEIVQKYYKSIKLYDGTSIPIRPERLPAIIRRVSKHNGGIDPRLTLNAGMAVSLPRVYIVGPKDTLAQITRKLYGVRRSWRDIYNINSDLIKNPDKIKPGWILLLPN